MSRLRRLAAAIGLSFGLLTPGIAAAAQDEVSASYADALPVVDNTNWLYGQYLEFRAFPVMDRAMQLREQGNAEAAIRELETLLDEVPNLPRAQYMLTVLQTEAGHPEAAEKAASALLDLRPDFAPARLYRGLARQRQNAPGAAFEDFQAALTGTPLSQADRRFAQRMAIEAAVAAKRFDAAQRLLNEDLDLPPARRARLRGVMLEGMTRYGEAERAYLKAAGLSEDDAAQRELLGFAAEMARRDGRPGAAKAHLLDALSSAPGDPGVLERLARLAEAEDDPAAAEMWVKLALAEDPDAETQASLLTLLAEAGRPESAIQLAEQRLPAIDDPDARQRIRLLLANLLFRQGRAAAAADAYSEAGAEAGSLEPLLSAAVAYRQAGRPGEAAAVLEQAAQRFGLDAVAPELADAYLALGRNQAALDAVEDVQPRAMTAEDRGRLAFQKARALQRLDRPAERRAALEQAVELQPGDPRYRLELGEALLAQNQPEAAVEQFRAAAAMDASPETRLRLANALAAAGRTDDAIAALEKLRATLDPADDLHGRVMQHLGNLYAETERYGDSAAAFLASVGVDGVGSADNLLRAAVSFAQDKAWGAALDALDRARAAVPADSPVMLELLERSAVVAESAGQPGVAVEHYQAMLAHPDFPQARRVEILRSLATVASSAGDDAVAIRAYRGIADSPRATREQRRTALESLAVVAERAGDYDTSIEAYRRLLDARNLDPAQRAEFLRRLAVIANVAGRQDLAWRTYRRLAGLPDAPLAIRAEAARSLAVVTQQRGGPGDADAVIALFQELLRADSLDQEARRTTLEGLARYAGAAGRPQLMADSYERLLALLPDGSPRRDEVLSELAGAYERLERPGKAIDLLQQLLARVEAEETRRRLLERLAVNAAKTGDHALQVRAYRELIALGSADWQIYQGLGVALRQAGDCENALPAFRRARALGAGPMAEVYAGYCYDDTGQTGLAIHHLVRALSDPKADFPPSTRINLLETLAFLYAESDQQARAAETWQRAIALSTSPPSRLRLARAQWLSDQADAAAQTLAGVAAEDLPAELRPGYYDLLAKLRRVQGDPDGAIAALDQAIALERTPDRVFRRGLLRQDLGRRDAAFADLEQAHEAAPDNADIGAALAYASDRRGDTPRAVGLLEDVVRDQPDRLPVYEDLAYMNKRIYENAAASTWFERVVDNQPIYPVDDEAERKALAEKQFAARRENQVLNDTWDVQAYSVLRSADGDSAFDPSGTSLLTSQGGLQVAHRLDWLDSPFDGKPLGFRDGRTLEVFGRLLWGYENGSLDYDPDSRQGGVGLRWKPIKTESLYLSGERLVAIGDTARDDWLLRASYSWDRGLDIEPVETDWPFATAFLDAAYIPGSDPTLFLTAQGQAGWSFKAAPGVVLTPHATASAQYVDPIERATGDTGTAWEFGLGLRGRYWFDETKYEAYRSYVDAALQYRAGVDADDETTHGLVLTLQLGF